MCAVICLSSAVYFVWSALKWESTVEMWLQHCNFDKMARVKVFLASRCCNSF